MNFKCNEMLRSLATNYEYTTKTSKNKSTKSPKY